MAQKATADTIVLKLEQTVDRAALAATGALGRLESQIIREQNQLGRLEASLGQAKVKLDVLAAGSPDRGVMAALDRQIAKVAELEKGFAAGKISADRLADSQAKLSQLKEASQAKSVDVAAYKKQELAIAQITDRIGAQKDKLGALGDKLVDSQKKSKGMTDAVKLLGTETGVSSNSMVQLLMKLKSLGPIAAVVAGAVLVTVASLGSLIGMFVKGITASGQMRAEFLKLQAASVNSAYGFSWLFNATRESSRAAEQMQKSINAVNVTSAAGRDKLTDYAVQIRKARFEGKQFETVLKAMSTASTGGTEQMAQDVLQWARQIRFMGGSVDDLARRVEQKLGRSAAAQAISLDVQFRRLGENIRWIFGGADIDPLLRALNSVLKIFNAGSDSATGMRNSITLMVESGIGALLRLGIFVLKTYIAIRQKETTWKLLATTIKGVFVGSCILALVVLGAIGIALTALAIKAAIVMAPFVALAASMFFLVDQIQKAFTEISWDDISHFILGGIVRGLKSGAAWVLEAVKNLASSMIKKFKEVLGISSPSKLFTAETKMGIGGGIVGGFRQMTPDVERASATVGRASFTSYRAEAAVNDNAQSWGGPRFRIGPPVINSSPAVPPEPPPRPASDGGLGSGGGPNFNFYNCVFGGTQSKEDIRALMHEVYEETGFGRGKVA
jgi:hypothetical protein